jgi:hypothetical protein
MKRLLALSGLLFLSLLLMGVGQLWPDTLAGTGSPSVLIKNDTSIVVTDSNADGSIWMTFDSGETETENLVCTLPDSPVNQINCLSTTAADTLDLDMTVQATNFIADPSDSASVVMETATTSSQAGLWITDRAGPESDMDLKVMEGAGSLTTYIQLDGVNERVELEKPLYIKEQADASTDLAGYGQIWINTATPNELWWTDDAGTDTQLGTAGGGDLTVSSANPTITFDDTGGADGIQSVQAADADDAVMTFGVDDSEGDDTTYLELDGVQDRVEILQPLYISGSTDIQNSLYFKQTVTTITGGAESPNDSESRGVWYVADHATPGNHTTFTLPALSGGYHFCFIDNDGGAGEVRLDPNGADQILHYGTALAAGEYLYNSGGSDGDFMCLLRISADYWATTHSYGTWAEETP